MRIKKIKVYSLYGNINLDWTFNDDVNILAGINGSYKTTILNIINQMTNHENVNYPVSSVEAEFTEGIKLTYTRRVSDLKSLLANRESNKVIVEKIEKEHPDWVSGGDTIRNMQIAIVAYQEEKDGQLLDESAYNEMKKIDYISTFDVVSKQDKETALNAELRRLQEHYAFYLSDLSRKVSNLFKERGNVTKTQVDEINQYRDEFISIVNDAFKETGKSLSEDESNLSFTDIKGHKIQLLNLSAGEKQFLIILLTVLLEKRQEFILIMDEPEISMHIDLQYTLIDNLLKINPAVQIIISTHSPAIFGAGWGDKVMYAEHLLKK